MKYTHKLVDLTEKAEHLSPDEHMGLEDMVFSKITLSDEISEDDGGRMFVMPDGELCHESFIVVEEIKSDSEKLKIVEDLMIDHCNNKYFDLVWYARNADHKKMLKEERYEGLQTLRNLENKYPEEIANLSKDDNWHHGFNSGMLAASRLYLSVIEDGLEAGLEEFPFLDS